MSVKAVALEVTCRYLAGKVAAKLKSLISVFVISVCFGISLCSSARSEVIVNEIMANEPGSETALEWIELYNAGTDSVELSDCCIIEGGDTTHFPADAKVAAGGFVVLSRKPTAAVGLTSFESVWGNGSGIWGDAPSEDYLLLSAKLSLRNTCDTVVLFGSSAGMSETVIWSSSQPDGVTLERINPFKPAGFDNFGVCRAVSGSTPGRASSLLPADNNLALVTEYTSVDTPSDTLQPIILSVTIVNRGLKESPPGVLLSYFDRDFSGNLSDGDPVDSVVLPPLLPDSVVQLTREYQEPPGHKRLIVQLPRDADSTDNILSFDFGFGRLIRELVINEFMPNPGDQLDCEWVELKSVVAYPVRLKGFSIGNVVRQYAISVDVGVSPAERVIVCEDTTAFIGYFGHPGCAVVQPEGWRRLDNLGDVLIVKRSRSLSDACRILAVRDWIQLGAG